jgi:hypothetical protein
MNGYFFIKILALLGTIGIFWSIRDKKRRASFRVNEILEFEAMVKKSGSMELPELIECEIGRNLYRNINVAGNGKLLFLWPGIDSGGYIHPNFLMTPLAIGMKRDLEHASSYLLNDVFQIKSVESLADNHTLLVGKLDNAFMNGTLGGSWKMNTKVSVFEDLDKWVYLISQVNLSSF